MSIALQGFGPPGGIALQGFVLTYVPAPLVPIFYNPSFEVAAFDAGWPEGWHLEDRARSFEPATFDMPPSLIDHGTELDHASWTPNGVAVTADQIPNPHGGLVTEGEQIQESGGASIRRLSRTAPVEFVAGKVYVFECYLKASTKRYAGLCLDAITDEIGMIVDLDNHRIASVLPGTGEGNVDRVGGRLTTYASIWDRLRLYFRCVSDFLGAPAIALAASASSFEEYAGSNQRIYAYGATLRELTPEHDAERFDAWVDGELIEEFAGPAASFDDPLAGAGVDGPIEAFEDFEEYWSANEDLIEDFFSAAASAIFDSTLAPEAFEDFEEGWLSNQDSYTTMPATAAASFDSTLTPEAFEDFEEGWLSNQDALGELTFTPGVTNPTFDQAEAFEDFEEVRFPVQVVPAPTLDTFTGIGHPFASNDRVTVEVTGGTIAGGVYPNTVYWIIYIDANNVKLSGTEGPGSAVDIQTSGSGTHFLRADPLRFWTRAL